MTQTTIAYLPVYSPSQQARLDRLTPVARRYFQNLLRVLDDAEALDGPDVAEYLDLLVSVIEEAEERRAYCRHTRG